jgi:hypothetical protein
MGGWFTTLCLAHLWRAISRGLVGRSRSIACGGDLTARLLQIQLGILLRDMDWFSIVAG